MGRNRAEGCDVITRHHALTRPRSPSIGQARASVTSTSSIASCPAFPPESADRSPSVSLHPLSGTGSERKRCTQRSALRLSPNVLSGRRGSRSCMHRRSGVRCARLTLSAVHSGEKCKSDGPRRRRFRRQSSSNIATRTTRTTWAWSGRMTAGRRQGNVTVPWDGAGPVHTTPRGPTLEAHRNRGTEERLQCLFIITSHLTLKLDREVVHSTDPAPPSPLRLFLQMPSKRR